MGERTVTGMMQCKVRASPAFWRGSDTPTTLSTAPRRARFLFRRSP